MAQLRSAQLQSGRCDISCCTGRAPKSHVRKIKDLVSYTEDETTVKSYDKQMRDRFKETMSALESINVFEKYVACIDVITKCYGVNTICELIDFANEMRKNLEETLNKYDLTVISHLMDGTNDVKYFATVSCENVDSLLLNTCVQLRDKISTINGIIIKIKDALQHHIVHEHVARKPSYVVEDEGIAQSATRVMGNGRGRSVVRMSSTAKKSAIHNTRVQQHLIESHNKSHRIGNYMTPELIISVCNVGNKDALIRSFNDIFNTFYSICERVDNIIEMSRPIYKGPEDDKKCTYCKGRYMRKIRGGDTICETCGHVLLKSGSMVCDTQEEQNVGRMTEVGRGKYSGYNYVRHLRLWMDRLQAVENFTFNAADVNRVRNSIISEYVRATDVNWIMLQCTDIERHLSLCGLTELNEHVPKLIKELGGRAPPILDYDTLQIITCDFVRIMEIYAQLFEETGNKPYYPFFIAKIIKLRFKNNDEVLRILNYVSRQGYDTVTKNDRIYQRICQNAPSEYTLVYEPEVE